MTTIVPEGPYGYTLAWEFRFNDDGSFEIPTTSTRQGVLDGYTEMHKHITVLDHISLSEIRGEWYSFHEGISGSLNKHTGEVHRGIGIVFCPVGSADVKGITGEMVWSPKPRGTIGVGASGVAEPEPTRSEANELRRQLIVQHDQFLQALRAADVNGILDLHGDGAQANVRDYVNDTGALVNLHGKDDHRSWYEALFDKYEVNSVDMLHRMSSDWYVFSELRYSVTPSSGGAPMAFHTAEWFAPGHDGRFIARIGHGTDVMPL
jgi:hypothetical protein